ncbi:MAG: type II secretion system protein N [Pseudomonadota bacterium]
MPRSFVILFAFMGLLIGLAAFMPARVAFDLLARPAGVQAELVHGPVWDARLFGVTVSGQRIEQVDARLSATRLLTGRAVVELAARDRDLRLDGVLVLRPGFIEAHSVRGAISLQRLPGAQNLPSASGESLILDIDRIGFELRDGCVQADGVLRSAALLPVGLRYEVELPVLEGALYCAGARLGVDVTGASDAAELTGQALLGRSRFEWRAGVERAQPGLAPVLIALGFADNGGSWSAQGEGTY